MNPLKTLEGTYVVNVTPFNSNDEVDFESLRNLLDFFVTSGIDGIFVGGSTGEFAYLSPEEHKGIIEAVVRIVRGRLPVIAGTAACSTKYAVELTRYAEEVGADGAVIVPPFYHKPTEQGVYKHYRAIAEAVKIPIMLYNNPFTSKVDMAPELIAGLAEIENIRYVKESSGDVSRIWKIRKLTNDRMTVFCGADNLAIESFTMGAKGFICVASNFIPSETAEIYHLFKDGKIDEAKRLYDRLLPILNLLEDTGKFSQISKAALNLLGKKVGNTRSPLLPLEYEEEQRLRKLLEELRI